MAEVKRQSNALKHGMHSIEAREPVAMTPFDYDSLVDLRELAKTAAGRDEIKVEIVARLTLVARKFFSDVSKNADDPEWWESGAVKRGGTYLAELRRWLDTMPPDKRDDAIDAEILKSYRTGGENAAQDN